MEVTITNGFDEPITARNNMKVFLFGVPFGEAILGPAYLAMTADDLRSVIDHYGMTVVRLENGQYRLIDLTNDRYTVVPNDTH